MSTFILPNTRAATAGPTGPSTASWSAGCARTNGPPPISGGEYLGGETKREAMRCLKRYVAREVYRALLAPTARRHADGAYLATRRKRLGLLRREVASELGVRVETVSAIERERAKYFAARDKYEVCSKGLRRIGNVH